MEKIKNWSRLIRIVTTVLLWVLIASVIIVVVGMFVLSGDDMKFNVNETELNFNDFSVGFKIILALLILAIGAVYGKGLYHIRSLFSLYEKGSIFMKENVEQIRQLGYTFIMWAGAEIAIAIVQIIAVANYNADGLNLTLKPTDSGPLTSIAIGLVIIVASWVMDEGRKLREDNELTV
jgi:hypothetical protein